MTFSPELHDACRIAQEAGTIARNYYGRQIAVERKEDTSPVTQADRAVESYITAALQEKYSYPILAEEDDDTRERLLHDTVWIVDPIDGTRDFIYGTDEFCILIGLAQQQSSCCGVIYNPIADTLVYAETGNGAYQSTPSGEQQLHVSDKNYFSRMRYAISHFHKDGRPLGMCLDILEILGGGQYRKIGSTGLRAAAVAQGVVDVYFHPAVNLSEWDACASEVVVRESGGMVTDIYGSQLQYNQEAVQLPLGFLATNNKRHADIVRHISRFSHSF